MASEVATQVFGGSKVGDLTGAYNSKRAYVTFLAGSGDYWKGIVGLAKSFRKVNSAYPLVVAMLSDVPKEHREILKSQGCICREIDPIYPPESEVKFFRDYFVLNYSKLRFWEFEEYSRMVYLDADIAVFQNIDDLFDMPDEYFYAVKDCFCEDAWNHRTEHQIGYCQQSPDRVQWPSELGPRPAFYFNAGMFVFKPSKLTFDSLIETLKITPITRFAEQDFLNMYFQKMYKPLPVVYNLLIALVWLHPENVDLDKVRVVHYSAGGAKPWKYTGEEETMQREDVKLLVQKWWDIYNDESLDFKAQKDSIPEAESLSDLL